MVTLRNIVDEHATFIARVLWRRGVPPSDLEDVRQEVLITAARSLADTQPTNVRAWLSVIARHKALHHLRGARRRPERPTDPSDIDTTTDTTTPETLLLVAEREATASALVATLRPKRRAVLVAHALDELPVAEVAAAFRIPTDTVRSRLGRARKDLAAAAARFKARRLV